MLVTQCNSLKEEAEAGWTKPNGYPYTRCEGAALKGQRRCEYCRMQIPQFHVSRRERSGGKDGEGEGSTASWRAGMLLREREE